ncbi:MAG TPA: OsmC family protein [Saprospiraceae bacterium]|nr:OsmC family protein [Saprospiraceae bacterium]
MNKTASVVYLGDLRTEATHHKSGQKIMTDAPTDNQGRGEAFSPTDLTSTSLACCMITIMGIAARTHQINIDGTKADVLKIMADQPRRIARIEIDIYFPKQNYTQKEKTVLERSAKTCPVAKSLHPDCEELIRFHYQDQ